MGISYQIPQEARFISTSTIFTAAFNVAPYFGKYGFTDVAGNTDVFLLEFQPNTIYLIERMSCGGNITEQQFLEAIGQNDFPFLYLKKKMQNRVIYQKPIPITNYFDGQEAAAYVLSDKFTDELRMTFTGVLDQLPSMIGITNAKIQISLNIFAIDSNYWNSSFRDRQGISIGQVNRR